LFVPRDSGLTAAFLFLADLDLSFIDEISAELSKIFHWAVGLIVVAGYVLSVFLDSLLPLPSLSFDLLS